MVYCKLCKGSPWMNPFAEAEKWVRREQNERLKLEHSERPNTKWRSEKFSNLHIEVVLDRQPMLGKGP